MSKSLKVPEPPPGETLVDVEFLAAFFNDITPRAIQLLVKRGIVFKAAHGQYYFVRSAKSYIAHLQKVASSHQSGDGKIDAVEESALLKRANREIVELKRAQIEGKLISIEELEEVWGLVMKTIRSMILAVPSRVGFARPHLTKDDLKAISKECEEVLKINSLSNPKIGPLPETSANE